MAKPQQRSIRVPESFYNWLGNLSEETERQTGMKKNLQATMRRMETKLNGKIIIKGFDFDFALIGRQRKR